MEDFHEIDSKHRVNQDPIWHYNDNILYCTNMVGAKRKNDLIVVVLKSTNIQ